MENEKATYRYLDKVLVANLLNSDEEAIETLGNKVTLLESLIKEDIKKYSTEREKRECIEIYSNVINELREVIYKYSLEKGINITEGVYQESVKPKLLYENNLIRGMEYMRTMFPPLDKDALVDYLDNYTRLLCKHGKEDRYSEELWFKTKMCLRYLDGILFSSDSPKDGTNYDAMTLENYLEFMLNENLIKVDPSRYVRYLKRYKPKHEQRPMGRVEKLFNDKEPKSKISKDNFDSRKIPQELPKDTTESRSLQDRYEMDMNKNIVPKPKKLDGLMSVGFIFIAIIAIIVLFYYMV